MKLSRLFAASFCVTLLAVPCFAEHDGKLQILLVGDSTTEASIPKMLRPQAPQLEEVVRLLLEAEGDLPPTNVINLGLSGEYIKRLIDSGRYDRDIAKIPGADYILVRYGLNDHAKRENFAENFPKDYHDLIVRLKKDHPAASIIVTTVIPFANEEVSERINLLNRQVAEAEALPLFDLYPRYAAELKKGENMLNYRRYPLAKVPKKFHPLVAPYLSGTPPSVVVMDNQLDAHLGSLPGWYGDRHPNLAGYHVIADETAKHLAPLIRARQSVQGAALPGPEQLFVATPLTAPGLFTEGIEGPACDKNGNIYAVNFQKQGTIGCVSPEGKAELFVTLPEGSTGNGIRFDRAGTMYVADYTGHQVLRVDTRTKAVTVFAHEPAMNQPNDLAISGDDVLYASDPAWKDGTGQLWRIGRDGKVWRLAEGLGTTNGIEVSPDGGTLYVNESVQRNVWAFAIQGDGTLGTKKLLRQFPDHGFDGMRCDIAGNLYITRHGKGTVVKMSPAGEILQEMDVLGPHPSNLCFGGPDGRTLYVTEVSQKRLVQIRVDQPGLEWTRQQAVYQSAP